MTTNTTAYIALGSNLGEKKWHLQKAIFELGQLGEITKVSNIYSTPSWGFEGEPFLNACVALDTVYNPLELMDRLLSIESKMGRKRKKKDTYTNRIIDLDLLYYGHEVVVTETLTIPHPVLHKRKFVLKPLADIAPQFYHPLLHKDTRNLLQECRDKTTPVKVNGTLFPNKTALFAFLEFFTIEGNIGAGKTTLTTKIAADFNGKLILEQFADNPFLPNFYQDQARYAFPLEMSFLAERYQQFMDDTNQYDLFKNFMLSDYDINKSLIFAKVTLQQQEFDLYRKIFGFMYKDIKHPKLYIYLYQTTERLLENIKKRGRSYEQGIDADYLNRINQGYLDFLRTYPTKNQLIIDISPLDFVADHSDYNTVVDLIMKHAVMQGY